MKTVGYAYSPEFLKHDWPRHPENARRLASIMNVLEKKGCLAECRKLDFDVLAPGDLLSVHESDYITRLATLCEQGYDALNPDTYLTRDSYRVASLAAGAGVAVVKAVLHQEVDSAFALIRPPGHHAFADHGEGFCLLNNVALAARHAIDRERLKRVTIIDWDVHHGNGTNDIFYKDPRVQFISTHQFPLYPGTGLIGEIGDGEARGTNVNVPMPPGAGDEAYERVFDEVIIPAVQRYRPELILISAGYDAHWREHLSGVQTKVTLHGFASLTHRVMSLAGELCGGKLGVLLEGGYDTEVLAFGVLNTLNIMRGMDEIHDPTGDWTGTETDVEPLIRQLKKIHSL